MKKCTCGKKIKKDDVICKACFKQLSRYLWAEMNFLSNINLFNQISKMEFKKLPNKKKLPSFKKPKKKRKLK